MTTRILSLMALLAALAAVPAPSFAADDGIAASTDEAVSPVPPPRCEPWMRDCRPERPPMHGRVECFARNRLGRTFVAYGDWRTPRNFVLRRAVEQCRYGSLPFLRWTCHAIGCRGGEGWDHGFGR